MSARRLIRPLMVIVIGCPIALGAQRLAHPPDLQGYWNIATRTPLQRPVELGNRTHFTQEEAAEFERTFFERARQTLSAEVRDLQIDLNDTWNETSRVDRLRTSLIIDPPDGRLPALLPDAKQRIAARPRYSYDGPEGVVLTERCLLGNRGSGSSALSPPIIPSGVVSPYYQIVQNSDSVMIFTEWVHDARVVRINGAHLPPSIKLWLGDSIGRWEGATLVVDTTNFRAETHNQESGERLHVVERFERTDPDTITYRVTADDPDTWATPWTAEILFKATTNRLFEYSCHEANYSMELYLRGARAEERRQVK